MNCAWCGPADEESHGICDACIKRYFGVDAADIHAEIACEAAVQEGSTREDPQNTVFWLTLIDRLHPTL